MNAKEFLLRSADSSRVQFADTEANNYVYRRIMLLSLWLPMAIAHNS